MSIENAHVELLAPAGNPTCLHAAVKAGADAVYLGLESFNARRGAGNFTYKTLREGCDYAHLRGVKIYLTLNTVIMDSEFKQALEVARQAWRAGVDAFIVQDIGVASEIVRTLPQARLHISTQMNTHNLAGIAAAASLGAARITLARELALEEIRECASYARELGMEVEVFAHGALCVCYSGQCLLSSLIGGRSANRGMCAQACRLPYTLHNRAVRKDLPSPGEYLLSPRDLCTIDILEPLIDCGISSLKIEGRMKAPEYVYSVVKTYRAVLDRIASGGFSRATEEERRVLAEAFSRGFTTAYLEHERGNDMMGYKRPNNRGVSLGRIGRTSENAAYVKSEKRLNPGDILEIWTGKGRATVTLDEIKIASQGMVRIPLDRKKRDQRAVNAGDRVFRVKDASLAFIDDSNEPKVPVAGCATVREGEPFKVRFDASIEHVGEELSYSASATGGVVEAARTKAVTSEEIRSHVDRMGQTPFSLASFSSSLDEGVGLGFSEVHRVRAEALEKLQTAILAPYKDRKLEKLVEREELSVSRPNRCVVCAWVTNPACARAARRAGAQVIYVPALNYKRGEALIAGQRNNAAEQMGYPKQCVIALPTIDHDIIEGTREYERDIDVWEYAKPGKPLFVDSLGALVRAVELGAKAEIGPHLPIANKAALDYAARLGAERVWLSPELTLSQISDLGLDGSPVPLGLTILGTQELMITEHCLLMSQGLCDEDCDTCPRRKSPHYLKDRKDFEFPVVTDCLGRSHLYNSVQLDVAHALPELIHAGISSVMVDTTLLNAEQTAQAVGRVVHAADLAKRDAGTVSKPAAATSGHLFRGVS
ncbi:MAG: U32 family peptidase [Eggerthellaceae bacterium]|nr:U32 family peptidase [Eggerthellaceae bacterium]